MHRFAVLRAPLVSTLLLCLLGLLAPVTLAISTLATGALAVEPAVADDSGPVTFDGIRQMRRERMSAKKIVAAIEQRGLGFAVDADTERRLRAMGFSVKMVAQLKGMRAVESTPAVAPAERAADEPPAAGSPNRPAGTRRTLDAATANEYQATAERVTKIVAASGTGVTAHPTAHINLLANAKIADRVRGDVEQLEKLIAGKFPEPIASGVDPRAANIVLLEDRYEYERWMRALFTVHEQSGLKFSGDEPLKTALATNAVFVPNIFSINVERMERDEIRRRLAFAVGYLYLRQLTEGHAPDALQTGFGNMTEVMMFHEPVTTVVSGYTDRRLAAPNERWIDMVRKEFAERKVPTLPIVLAYSTQSMNVVHYAESWTLTTLLASDPKKFGELVTRLGKNDPPAQAISEIYGMKEDALVKRWTTFVLRNR